MNSAPISVVMSVYNGDRFLDEAIHSIRSQTYKNFEFVIVNDGSMDASPHILLRHSTEDPRIRVISQENRGLVDSLQTAFSIASGTYIARMDADDVSKPFRLEKQLHFLERNPSIALVGGALEVVDSESRVQKIVRPTVDPDELRHELREHGNPIAHPTVMFRRCVVQQLGGLRRAYRHAEDYDLWLRMVESFDLANIPEVLLSYRRHEFTVSYRNIEQQALSALCARTTAKLRLNGQADPTSNADLITEALLRDLGVAQETIDDAIFNNILLQVEDAIESGICSVAAEFARMARSRAPTQKVKYVSLELNRKAAESPATSSEKKKHRTMLLLADPPTYWSLFKPDIQNNPMRRKLETAAKTAMFSVLIPVYNHGNVKQAVVSALRSPLVNEIIVLDAGSTDDSADILEELAASNPHRIINVTRKDQISRGVHDSLNELVGAAKSDWVALLNGNDSFVEGRFDKIVSDPSFAECEFFFGNLLFIDRYGRLIGARRGPFDPAFPFPPEFNVSEMVAAGNLLDLIAHQNLVGTISNMVFTKALHARIGGFAPLPYLHDWDFALRALTLGRCCYLRRYLTAWRVPGGSEYASEIHVEARRLFDRLLNDLPHLAERSNFQIALRDNRSLLQFRPPEQSGPNFASTTSA